MASASASSSHSPAACRPSTPGSSLPSSLYEPLVYFCSVLKNVSSDASNQRHLVRLGALSVLGHMLGTAVVGGWKMR